MKEQRVIATIMAIMDDVWSGATFGFGIAVFVLTLKTIGNSVSQIVTGTSVSDWAEGLV